MNHMKDVLTELKNASILQLKILPIIELSFLISKLYMCPDGLICTSERMKIKINNNNVILS